MSVYKRGETYWFKFAVGGQTIRESAHTSSKTLAKEAERVRRRELEQAINRIPRRQRMPLFSFAAEQWLQNRKPTLSKGAYEAYRASLKHLIENFGRRLVCDLDHRDIAALQEKLTAAGKSARTVNLAVATLRMILKGYGLWTPIADHVKGLRERSDVGKAIPRDHEEQIIEAIQQSRSPALLPLFVLSIDTGLRAAEVRALRRRDFRLAWRDGVIEAGELSVPKSKTKAGTNRVVPLTRRVCAVLTLWFSRLPQGEEGYAFPAHRVGMAGDDRAPHLYAVDSSRPMGFWKKAWQGALRRAGLEYRWHDTRHSFISRLCENPTVSEQTIMSLAGHVSRSMLQRYSHIRNQARRAAIATLEESASPIELEINADRAQNRAQQPNPETLN